MRWLVVLVVLVVACALFVDASDSGIRGLLRKKRKANSRFPHTTAIRNKKDQWAAVFKYCQEGGEKLGNDDCFAKYSPWTVEFPVPYTPKNVDTYDHSEVEWADYKAITEREKIQFNAIDGNIDRRTWIGCNFEDRTNVLLLPTSNTDQCAYAVTPSEAGHFAGEDDIVPINPYGRTGVSGRGPLGKWGPNHAADTLVVRMVDGNVQFASIFRAGNKVWAFPGGMVDNGEVATEAAVREFLEEAEGGDPAVDSFLALYRAIDDQVRFGAGLNTKQPRDTALYFSSRKAVFDLLTRLNEDTVGNVGGASTSQAKEVTKTLIETLGAESVYGFTVSGDALPLTFEWTELEAGSPPPADWKAREATVRGKLVEYRKKREELFAKWNDLVTTLFNEANAIQVYEGYVDDERNTDNAWMETKCYIYYCQGGCEKLKELHAGDDATGTRWYPSALDQIKHLELKKKELETSAGDKDEIAALATKITELKEGPVDAPWSLVDPEFEAFLRKGEEYTTFWNAHKNMLLDVIKKISDDGLVAEWADKDAALTSSESTTTPKVESQPVMSTEPTTTTSEDQCFYQCTKEQQVSYLQTPCDKPLSEQDDTYGACQKITFEKLE